MPSIADIPTSPTMSKKRRREDHDSPIRTSNPHIHYEPQIHTDDSQTRHFHPYPNPKKRIQETGIKRQRIDTTLHQHPLAHDEFTSTTRPPLSEMLDHQMEIAIERKLAKRNTARENRVDLSACHICHRKPTEKKHLDSYTDCQGCGNRTCYICVRECKGLGLMEREREKVEGGVGDVMVVENLGEHQGGNRELGPWERDGVETHRDKICSMCCVEKGTEGEVWCLGCLKAGEGG